MLSMSNTSQVNEDNSVKRWYTVTVHIGHKPYGGYETERIVATFYEDYGHIRMEYATLTENGLEVRNLYFNHKLKGDVGGDVMSGDDSPN